MASVDLCVFGLGSWGLTYLRLTQALPEVRVVAVCDPDPVARHRAAEIVPHAQLFERPNEAFGAIQGRQRAGVIVATPLATHAELALTALERGLCVLVEKPLAATRTQAEALVRVPSAARLGSVGHLLTYHPGIRQLARMTREGAIGRLIRVDCLRTSAHSTGIADPRAALWQLAPHDLSVVLFLLGAFPRAVRVTLDSRSSAVHLHLRFANLAVARIEVARGRDRVERRMEVEGTRGTIRFDELASELRHGEKTEFFETNPLLTQLRAFVDQILGAAPAPEVNFRSGCNVVACLQAGAASLASDGLWVSPVGRGGSESVLGPRQSAAGILRPLVFGSEIKPLAVSE